jgi:hypothetical protein
MLPCAGCSSGFKIPHIENLGVTNDEYEVIDLSDNDLSKLENFPLLKRLTTLLVCNNRVNKIALELNKNLPKLDALILTNNRFSALTDLDPLACLTTLRTLCLRQNPITTHADYRAYVIHLLPNLHSLDFAKVKPAERVAAEAQFGPAPTAAALVVQAHEAAMHAGAEGKERERVQPGQAVPMGQAISLNAYGGATSSSSQQQPRLSGEQLIAEKKRLFDLIAAAKSLDEVNNLQKQLEQLIARHS